jgi:hypothetical protein
MNLLQKVRRKFSTPARHQSSDHAREKYIRRERYIITDLILETLPARERFIILEGGAANSFRDPRWRAGKPAGASYSQRAMSGHSTENNELARPLGCRYRLGLDSDAHRHKRLVLGGVPMRVEICL